MMERKTRTETGRPNPLAALCLGAALGLFLTAATPARAATRAPLPAQAMPQMRGAAKLDAPHRELEKLVGVYSRVVKFLGQAGAAAAPSYGTSRFSVVLGGRFILERSRDVVFGQPVEGLRIYGYNDATKQYEMARMYTMSTAITSMKGTSSDGGRTIVFAGETQGPGGGSVPLHARLHWDSPNRFTVTMSMIGPDGKERPFQETIYTRKK